MFGNMIGLSEFWSSGFRCEDLILLCFCLHILNYKMLKPNNEIKCEYLLKHNTIYMSYAIPYTCLLCIVAHILIRNVNSLELRGQ